MRELRKYNKSQFSDINSQFDEITGKLDAIIELLPDWLRSNGIEPVDRIVVPSDQVTSNIVDDLFEVNQSLDSDLNCEKVSVTKQSWIDSEAHRDNNDGSTYEEISVKKEVADAAFQVFDEMKESIGEALLEEQMYTKLEFLLDSTFSDVQLIEKQQVEEHDFSVFGEIFVQNGACNVFDKMSKPTPSDFQLEKEYYDTVLTGNVELNEFQEVFAGKPETFIAIQQPFDITLLDPGGNKLYAVSSSGGILPGLFGIAHVTCDNGVEEVDWCKIVMKSDTYNVFNEMPKSNSTSKGFNDGVRYGRDTENEVATKGSNSHESQFSLIPNEQFLKTLALFKHKKYESQLNANESQLHFISSEILLNYSQLYGEFSAYNHLVIDLCCYLFKWVKSRDSKTYWILSTWDSREVLLWNCSVLLLRCKRACVDFHGALAQIRSNFDQVAPRLSTGHYIGAENANIYCTAANMLILGVYFGDKQSFIVFYHLGMFLSVSHVMISLLADSIANGDSFSKTLCVGTNSKLVSNLLCCWILSWDRWINEMELVSSFGSRISLLFPLGASFSWDPGICTIFANILEDKDVLKRVGKEILEMVITRSTKDEQIDGKCGLNKACKPLCHDDEVGCGQNCILHYLQPVSTPPPFFDLNTNLNREFLKRFEYVIMSIINEFVSLLYPPSVSAAATLIRVMRDIEPCELMLYQNQLMDGLKLRSVIPVIEIKSWMLYVRRISSESQQQQLSFCFHSVSFRAFQNRCCVLECLILMLWLVDYKSFSYDLGSYTILALEIACYVNFYPTSNEVPGAKNGVVQKGAVLEMWLQLRNEDFDIICWVFGARAQSMSSVKAHCLLLETMLKPLMSKHSDGIMLFMFHPGERSNHLKTWNWIHLLYPYWGVDNTEASQARHKWGSSNQNQNLCALDSILLCTSLFQLNAAIMLALGLLCLATMGLFIWL